MSDEEAPAELAGLFAAFSEDESAHADFLAHVETNATPPPLGIDTPAEPPSLEDALRAFALNERQARRLALDPGFAGDLVVVVSKLLKLVDPALRASFPWVNAFLEGAAAGFPCGSLVVHALLALAEGPLLSLLEGWLARRAAQVEAIEKQLADEEAEG